MDTSPDSRRAGWRFIRRALGGAALLIGAWMALLTTLPLPGGKPVALSVGAVNHITAERFLLSPTCDVVLVGSSITMNLPAAHLGPGITNLGMAGLNACNGLELVLAHAPDHGKVAIEINFIYNHDDHSFINDTLDPMRLWLQRVLPISRTENQPINVLLRLLKRGEGDATSGPVYDPPQDAVTIQRRDDAVKRMSVEMAKPPPEPDWSMGLMRLQTLAEGLRARGMLVAFYELPIDPRLMNAPRQVAARAELHRRFAGWTWLELPQEALNEGRDTNDSIHLRPAAAARTADYLRSLIAKW